MRLNVSAGTATPSLHRFLRFACLLLVAGTSMRSVEAQLPPPPGVTATVVGNSVVLTWTKVQGAATYVALMSTDRGMTANVRNVGVAGSESTATFTNVAPGTYYFTVQTIGYMPIGAPSTVISASLGAAPAGWSNTMVKLLDIAVSANGIPVGIDAANRVVRLSPDGYSMAQPGTSAGVRVAADTNGYPWYLDAAGYIYYPTPGVWTTYTRDLTQQAIDIAIGANGQVWVLGLDGVPVSLVDGVWTRMTGSAKGTRISVDPNGNPWVVNAATQIFRHNGTAWQQLGGAGTDVSVGPDGTVYVVGLQTGTGGNAIWRFDGNSWVAEPGVYGSVVAAGAGVHAYVGRTAASGLAVIVR